MALLELNDYVVCPQLIIQGVPNLSTSIPQRSVQKVCCNGILTVPFSANALNTRSPSATMSPLTQLP